MATRAAAARGGRGGRGDAAGGRGNIPVAVEIPIAQPPTPEDFELDKVAKRYRNLGGKPFTGTGTVTEAIAWLKTCEKIFEGMGMGTNNKARLGIWLLQEEAELWWDAITSGDAAGTIRTWEQFKTLFNEKFVPEQALERMREQFANLQQGDLSIQDYLNKFTQLSRYAPELILTNKAKNKRFIFGLKRKYHDRAMSNIKLSFTELVEMACNYEDMDERHAS